MELQRSKNCQGVLGVIHLELKVSRMMVEVRVWKKVVGWLPTLVKDGQHTAAHLSGLPQNCMDGWIPLPGGECTDASERITSGRPGFILAPVLHVRKI